MPSTEQAERFGTILTARSSLAAARYRAYLDAEIPVWDGLPSPADRATSLALRWARFAATREGGSLLPLTIAVPRVFSTATWRDPHANGARGYRDTVVNWRELYCQAERDIDDGVPSPHEPEPEPEMVSPDPDPLASGASFTTRRGSVSAVAYRQYLRRQMRAYERADEGSGGSAIWHALYDALSAANRRYSRIITIPVCWRSVPTVTEQDSWRYTVAVQDYENLLAHHIHNTNQESPLPVNTTIDPAVIESATFTASQRLRPAGRVHLDATTAPNDLERLLQEEEAIENSTPTFGEMAAANATATINNAPPPTYNRENVTLYAPGTFGMEEYAAKLREAADFLRGHSSGRYSDRTHGRFLRKAEAARRVVANRGIGFETELELPQVLVIEEPFSYDEETEVKRGGIIGVALLHINTETGKQTIYVAVKEGARRRKAGRALVNCAKLTYGPLHTYVNTTAGPAPMLFALNEGFYVCGFTSDTGVIELIRY